MSQYNMSPLPDLETGDTIQQIYRNQKTIKNWLFQLNEQLRYNLYNMEVENFTEQTVDQLTSVSDDVKAQLQVLDGKITAAVTAADGRFAELQIDIDGITTRVGDAEGNISSLQQTATSITSTVQDMEGNISVLQQTATSLTTAIQNAEGDISSLQQTASSLTSRVSDAEDNISSVEQTAEKIDWVVASGTSASNFQLTSRMASLIADEVEIQTDSLVISSISYGGSCYVQCSSDGVSIYPGNGNVSLGNPSSTTTINGRWVETGTLYPSGSPNCISGSGNAVFTGQVGCNSVDANTVYYGQLVESSDRRLKYDITELEPDAAKAFILALKPSSYHLIMPRPESTENIVMPLAADAPTRYGFIAQEVQDAMAAAGYADGIVDTLPEGFLGLQYTDIIAPLVKTVQWMEARITALEEGTA